MPIIHSLESSSKNLLLSAIGNRERLDFGGLNNCKYFLICFDISEAMFHFVIDSLGHCLQEAEDLCRKGFPGRCVPEDRASL